MKASELPSRCPLLHEQRPGRSRLRAVPVATRLARFVPWDSIEASGGLAHFPSRSLMDHLPKAPV